MRLLLLLLLTSLSVRTAIGSTTMSEPPATARAAIWQPEFSPDTAEFARAIGRVIERAGWDIEFLDSMVLTNVTRLTTARYAVLVLPDARRMPLETVPAIQSYLTNGGDLIALGLPAWQDPVFRRGDRWITRSEYVAALERQRPEGWLLQFASRAPGSSVPSAAPNTAADSSQVDSVALNRWNRHTNRPDIRGIREIVPVENGDALHVALDRLEGWDTLEPPPRPWSFPTRHTLTCFRAKGTASTRQLAVEWIEQDGSRWIATVDLTPQWRRYALPPESFKPWQPPSGRGGPADRLRLDRLARFTVGLAWTHTNVRPGPQEYWFADLGSANNPFGDEPPPTAVSVPRLESLSPDYMCYPIGTATAVSPPSEQALLASEHPTSMRPGAAIPSGVRVAASPPLLALHPRPRGVGFDQDRPFRWQPILEARDASTIDERGAVAAMIVHLRSPYRGSVWALFTPGDPEFYQDPAVAAWIEQTARRLRTPVYIEEGGSQFFTVFPDQAVMLGARVANFSQRTITNVDLVLSVADRRQGKLIHRSGRSLTVAAGETAVVTNLWTPDVWPDSECAVAVQLSANNQVLDKLEHDLNRWVPKAGPEFLEAREGALWLGGQCWKAHGVNYMPSSGIGVASDSFEYWLGRGAYDPEVIERDLRRIQGMGLNAVSVFVYHRDLRAQHLLDLLFRCARLGLKVNLSLRPGTPMEFRWDEMRALIEHYQLARNDTVIAYDLAWEPSHFDERYQQRHYASAWNQWLRRRYGSPAQAVQAWGEQKAEPRPSTPGAQDAADAPVPPMAQLTRDGPWRRRVADYRAFLDQLLGEKYAEARRLVRSIDPHHLVSFRMQHAGDPTHNAEGMLPYDFYGLRGAVDIWEPEAYGRIGDWQQVKPGHFTAAYARLCDPAKPLVWAEMGYSVWDSNRGGPDPDKLEFAARYYRDFYRMLRESGADGVFFWWYPGGYRLRENSDFGIIHPDGTDRPVTRAIREEGPLFLAAPQPPPPTHWIEVDRDRDARGLHGIYEAVKAEYWSNVEAGRQTGLKWKRTPGAH